MPKAADKVGTINGAAISGVCSSVGSFNKDGMGATIISCNGDSLIQEAVKLFDTTSFMVALGNAEKGADSSEGSFEGACHHQ
jgi:hypothetical protein